MYFKNDVPTLVITNCTSNPDRKYNNKYNTQTYYMDKYTNIHIRT